ncbi:MAG TPA: septum formation family protein [Actinomycetes bacterium]|nr:septum formation family protein [Actinomycetes bacterium]
MEQEPGRSVHPDESGPAPSTTGDELTSGQQSRVWSSLRAPFTLLVILAAAVIVITTRPWESSSSDNPIPRPSPTAAPVVDYTPVVGQCHTYSFYEFEHSTETSIPVPCTDPQHVSLTVSMQLPVGVSVPYEGSRFSMNTATKSCEASIGSFTQAGGPGVEFSLFAPAVFEPTSMQLQAGQQWLRCDVVEITASNTLKPLTQTVSGAMERGPDPRDALCVRPVASVRALPERGGNAPTKLWPTPAGCHAAGSAVAIRTERAKLAGNAYPGADAAQAAGKRACEEASSYFVNLSLTPLVPQEKWWTPNVLCVTSPAKYAAWVANGKTLAD